MEEQLQMVEALEIEHAEAERRYAAFTDKFKPKKTTDDCFTPEPVYEAVASWVAETYGVDLETFVRPFWPGGDYRHEEYPAGCVVVDNPPFSILSEIERFYLDNGVRFFLFGPTLTMFKPETYDLTYVIAGVQITYENGAVVNTSFVTNLDTVRIRTAPDLFKRVKRADEINTKGRELPKYIYPDDVVTSGNLYRLSKYGIPFVVQKREARFIRAMDEQRENGAGCFGNAFLISERAAAERAAAERAAAERAAAERAAATRWKLSDREREIQRALG